MANISDKFNKVSNGTGLYPVVATVTAPRATGDTILTCDSLAGWATDTAVHFSTYALNPDGLVDKTTQTDWKGIVVNNTITNIERKAGRDDFGNIAGDKVELLPTGAWANDLMDGLLIAHDQNGQLKDGSITSSKIASNSISEAKIAPLAVTTAKIADGAVTQDKIMGGWKLIGEVNGSGTDITLSLDRIYTTGTFKIIASGQCNTDGWLDLRAYHGNAVGEAIVINTSYSMMSFYGADSTFHGVEDDSAYFIASGMAKAYDAFSLETTSSLRSASDYRAWNFNFGCGVWGRIGTAREAQAFNKTAFSLTGQNNILNGHIEVWWHE